MSDPALLSGPAASAPVAEEPLTIERAQAYVWARYVQFEPPACPVDEDEALALFERHYEQHAIGSDAECFYYGILAYERSFGRPHLRRKLLRRALTAFEAYRQQTSEGFSFAPVDDRRAHVVDDLWPALERTVGTALD